MTTLAPLAELQALFALFGARRYAQMEQDARALVVRYPDDGNGWKALSVALQLQGGDAVPALQRAIALLPHDAELPSNLGNLLSDAGRLEESLDSYARALAIAPDFADAHANLGVALTRLGRFDDAVASLQRALQRKPAFPEAHNNIGNALMGLRRPHEALAHYAQALALRPGFALAQRGHGNALCALGRFDEAAASYARALALAPGDAQAHASLGGVLHQLGRLDAAVASFGHALAVTPDLPEWHFKLGNVLADAGQLAPAVASFERAVALQPGYLAALANLGVALLRLGDSAAAVARQRAALAIDPGAVAVRNNLGNALLAGGQPDEALRHYHRAIALQPEAPLARHNLARALKQLGRFDEALDQYRQLLARDAGDLAARSDMLFLQNFIAYRADADLLADACAFGAQAAARAQPYRAWPRAPRTALRVGLVSGDLREHPVGYFAQTALAALAGRAAGRIELVVYANHRADDAVTRRIAACCTRWQAIDTLADAEAAALIHADGIDILIDLAGHTAHNRLPLFAWRPAPLQLSWLGYCASTGMAEIDYVLTDRWIAPDAVQAQYVETLWRLPDSFLCFTPPDLALAVSPLPALRGDAPFTFGCFNNLSKVNDEVVAVWARVLLALPASRLFLKAPQLDAAANCAAITAQFARHGVGAARLLLEGACARASYLAAYGRVDIALDPFPYPGGTTSVEGLWMGVPVLSMTGQRALARQGESILRNLGMDDWIAADADDLVARAVHHAGAPAALAAVRAGLRARLLASPLCDAPRFAAALETALAALWERRPADRRAG